MLSKLLFLYQSQKEILYSKHKEVLKYLEDKSYDVDLSEIYEKINEGHNNKPYNIYISDDNYIIKNTTFRADYNFDLSFAKDLFLKHKKENIIGNSPPIFETYSLKFFSYTDSILPNTKNSVLQVSYNYDELINDLKSLQNLIDFDPNIKDTFAYIIVNDGFIGDFIFKNLSSYKPDLNNILQRIESGNKIYNLLKKNQNIKSFEVVPHSENLTESYYYIESSEIFDGVQLVYEIIFSQEEYKNTLQKLHLAFIFVLFFGILTILALFNYRKKEQLLKAKDKFIEHAVHEIKTPLAIMNLNLQLRNKHLGEDKYSQKIEAALKTLKNSYEDMNFLHTKENIIYNIKILNLKEVLQDRVNYFTIIAKSQNREIILDLKDNCFVAISKIELERLIDNNLSNAIKYSFIDSKITISLEKSILKFNSFGENISNTKRIFEKYSRENQSSGGHGLGLSIVKDICIKYNIKFFVDSKNNQTTFFYKFKTKENFENISS